jgi:hypothetical protein
MTEDWSELGHHGPKDRDRALNATADLIAEAVERLLFLQMTGPEGTALDTVLTALRAAEAENARLTAQLAEQKRFAESCVSTITNLMGQNNDLRRALGGKP